MFSYYLDLALRSLKRNKILTTLMVIAIAVGIGASMTTLTVMHLLSGDPLPGRSRHIFYPQVDPSLDPDPQHSPWDVMVYRSAVDLWSAHRGDILRYFQTENFLIVSGGIVLAFGLNLTLMKYYELARLPLYYLPIGALVLWALGQLAVLGPALRAAAVPPVVATRSI